MTAAASPFALAGLPLRALARGGAGDVHRKRGAMAEMRDEELIRRVLSGRRDDFALLVERYQRPLYAFVYRVLQDADAADETVQTAFVQAYTHLGQYRGTASFKTWLHQIALNECRSRHRRARARQEVPLDEVPDAALVQRGDQSAAAAEHAVLERQVERLPARQRAVLTLRVFADLPFREIARLQGITENAAKVSYHHAVMRLRLWLRSDS